MEALSHWLSQNERLAKARRRAWRVVEASWHLGFTSFGGPPVHFKILYDKYVTKLGWIDEQIYQELFSLSQALSGPASTKMLYCINLLCEGFLPAVLGFLLWSLPGAFGMFGLCVGVSNIGETLPRAAYALLSGLNASIVGVIALAAVQLSQKAITDKLTRILVFLGASAGMLYNALWYFPILIVLAGIATVVFDSRLLHPLVRYVVRRVQRRRRTRETEEAIQMQAAAEPRPTTPPMTQDELLGASRQAERESTSPGSDRDERDEARVVPADRQFKMSWKIGLLIISLFFASFIAVIVVRATIKHRPLFFSLFANLYLAGTIIFGGGPVVIPLLREYVVAEGWVSPRDFLIGLAVIQAFPGPNFNFAVYLGGLTAANAGLNTGAGAIIGFIAIFAPGLILCHGTMGLWSALRSVRIVKSALRGFNAAAVGLIYTAVYRLWQIGYIDEGFTQGTSLANDPWWVVVTATSYVGGAWFNLSAPVTIILGAVLGLVRYGVVA
ncbi:chromate transporter-domain-containing protein [Nemania sp. NC0429]|nr:chromate transporter-domain-containing protein [Nemania sp. NC0429]